MNRDFAEMLAGLSAAGADFMVIGAHAVAVHARPRATGDRDDLTSDDLVFQIGVEPNVAVI